MHRAADDDVACGILGDFKAFPFDLYAAALARAFDARRRKFADAKIFFSST